MTAKLRLGHIPTPRSVGGSDDEAARIRPFGVTGAGKSSRKDAAHCCPPMSVSSPSEACPQAVLSAVSIHDYETLMAPREAFVDFLLTPQTFMVGTRDAGLQPLAG